MSEYAKREAINRLVTRSAALEAVLSGITSSETAMLNSMPASVAFTFAAGAANVADIVITVKDANGATLTGVKNLTVYLSDAATGIGVTGTAASGTVQAKAASGTDLAVITAKKVIIVQTLATGIYTLEITATGKTGYYVCVINPFTGAPIVSRVMTSADYGA